MSRTWLSSNGHFAEAMTKVFSAFPHCLLPDTFCHLATVWAEGACVAFTKKQPLDSLEEGVDGCMDSTCFSPYPHLSWLGTWTTVGRSGATVEIAMRQVAHCLIYTSHAEAKVRWHHHGRDEAFRVDAGTVRFCPADDDDHTLVGQCSPGHRFYTLLIPQGHLSRIADSEGIPTVPELRPSVSAHDAVLTSTMRTLSNVHQHLDDVTLERQDAAALSLVLRLLSMNGGWVPDWTNDNSVFSRRVLDGIVAYIDEHLPNPLPVSEMCLRVGLSPGHFAKKFGRSTGLSLQRFVNYRRIRKSLSLLKERSHPLKSIASVLGFSSHSHFTRTFTDITGMSPVRYRRQFKRVVR